jgi:hypothetical protein
MADRKTLYVNAENSFAAEDAALDRAAVQFGTNDVTVIQASVTGTDGLYEVEVELGEQELAGIYWSPRGVDSIGPEFSLATDSQDVWAVLDSIGLDYDALNWNAVFYRVEDGEIVEAYATESSVPRNYENAYRIH